MVWVLSKGQNDKWSELLEISEEMNSSEGCWGLRLPTQILEEMSWTAEKAYKA